jgi:serine/threonine protein kinase
MTTLRATRKIEADAQHAAVSPLLERPHGRFGGRRDVGSEPVGRAHPTRRPVSTLDGVHPGLAITAMGPDEEDVPVVVEPDAWVGRVLSNVYRVEQKIGEGGMGAVYLARHIHLQKPYAIKVLTTTVANNGQAVERLKQEAIAASSIEHDNIVDVVNFDRADDGSVFIVMELLRGESLHARLARGPMAPSEALPIAWQICAALGAAHARGIVHRDLKPENVFLAKRGDGERVKVLDFGISKVKSAEADGVRMTRTGQLVGTPLYMSPEQAKGEQDIDLRVDVYALGVMLYEMLVGAPPSTGGTTSSCSGSTATSPRRPCARARKGSPRRSIGWCCAPSRRTETRASLRWRRSRSPSRRLCQR